MGKDVQAEDYKAWASWQMVWCSWGWGCKVGLAENELEQDTGQTCEGLMSPAKKLDFILQESVNKVLVALPISNKREPIKSGLSYKDIYYFHIRNGAAIGSFRNASV